MVQPLSQIEVNPQFQQAFALINAGCQHVLIIGKAGTGKSTFLNYLRAHSKKQLAVLAPTGVAAVNIGGITIHSFCKFSIDVTLEKVRRHKAKSSVRKVLKQLNTIVIDEISMVRADLLDCVNKFLQLNGPHPKQIFGGIQMIFIGDLYQIPPVVKRDLAQFFTTHYASPYFFSAQVFVEHGQSFALVEFEKIYRQADTKFINILNAIRNNTMDATHLQVLNSRLQPEFKPHADEFWVHITGTNDAVKKINDAKLAFLAHPAKEYAASVSGNVTKESFPADSELKLKVGAQVMLVNNDPDGQWVNGSIGQITKIKSDQGGKYDTVVVRLASGEEVSVYPHSWDVFKYEVDESTHALTTNKLGSFTQYPLRLAWALTVHKSQGKTFERVIVDLGTTFTPGQMYVALSRGTSLEGLVLKKAVTTKNIFVDWRIVKFLTQFQYQKAEQNLSAVDKFSMIEQAIKNQQLLEMVYLRAQDEKSTRVIKPLFVGEKEYQNKKYIGVEGLCQLRQEKRCFRVDRILELRVVMEKTMNNEK